MGQKRSNGGDCGGASGGGGWKKDVRDRGDGKKGEGPDGRKIEGR